MSIRINHARLAYILAYTKVKKTGITLSNSQTVTETASTNK